MRWPFVHRARLEAAHNLIENYCRLATAANEQVAILMEQIVRMKQQGFVAVPPKRAPKPDYTAEPETPDPFIEQQVREGVPAHLARQAQLEAIEAFESGDA